jgi:hypothetical protein
MTHMENEISYAKEAAKDAYFLPYLLGYFSEEIEQAARSYLGKEKCEDLEKESKKPLDQTS